MKLASAEDDRVRYASEASQLTERMETLQALGRAWESTGRKRLKEVEKTLESGKYAVDEQKRLDKLDRKLAKLGYDTAAHDYARQAEIQARSVDEEYSNLKSAREVSRQIESEIANLMFEVENRKTEVQNLEMDYSSAKA